jgi:pilus assembly protein CpaF
MLVQVVIESKGRSERRLIDVTTGVLTIGRAATCTLPIESTLISRTHVSVDMNGRRMRVTDSSTNGTLAGDRFVRGSSEDVPFGVPIVLGDHTVWLEASDPAVARTFESASEKAQKPTTPEPQPARDTISTRTRARQERRELEGAPTPKPSAKPLAGSPPRLPAEADTAVLEVLAPVRPFLDDPSVREVVIHGPDRIYVERRGRLERVPAAFADDAALLTAIRSLSPHLGGDADESRPILEGRLPDGSRVVAVLSPVAHDGPHVAIRRPRREPWTVGRLVELGSLTSVAASALEAMVVAKLNILVAGRPGSGKTALLGALTQLVPGGERVVVLEEAREMLLETPHVVRLEGRAIARAPGEETSAGAADVIAVLRAALLLRPDRLVVGDIRGAEAGDLAQAMTGGREGFMGCLYASSPLDALARFETMWMTSESRVPFHAMQRQIGSAVQLIVQTSRMRDGTAKVTHITEVAGFDHESQRYLLRDLFVRGTELEPTGVEPAFLPRLREQGVELPAAMKSTPRPAL